MSESTASPDVDPSVVDAIEDNPEDVAALVAQAGLDDQVVAAADGKETPRKAESSALTETIDANDEELAAALDRLADLEANGDLETVIGAMQGVSLLSDAMDDELVMSLGSTASSLGELADAASTPETRQGTLALIDALGEAAGSDPEPVGMLGLAGALRDDDIRQGLGFLLAVARATGRRIGDDQ